MPNNSEVKFLDPERAKDLAGRIVHQTKGIVDNTLSQPSLRSFPTIETAGQLQQCGNHVKVLRTLLKGPTPDKISVAETFDEPVAAANKLHKMLLAQKEKHAAPLEMAIRALQGLANQYVAREERKRLEEESRLRREADERRRKELAEAEASRLAEQAALDSQAKRHAEEAAAMAERAGLATIAQDIRQNPVPAEQIAPVTAEDLALGEPEIKVESKVPHVAGMATKTRITFKVVDPNKIPACYLLPPESKLFEPSAYPRVRANVESLGKRCEIPGIEVVEVTETSFARR